MRLTLRAMLAYMDGNLDPEDAEEIGKKIADSEQATALLHRTRDVMRRLRLAAPAVTERGSGLDPNTVAEYLDHKLPDDRVPDFEKVCLDSDIHLAEVASCHQILTLVLGEAADIDSAARQRMYQLIETAETAVDSSVDSSSGSIATEGTATEETDAETPPDEAKPEAAKPPAVKPRRKPVVPDYLRDLPRKSRWPRTAAALVLTVCLAGVVLAYLGYFDRDGALMCGLLGPVAVVEDSQPKTTPADPKSDPSDPSVEEPTPPAPVEPELAPPIEPEPGPIVMPPVEPEPAPTPPIDAEPAPVPPEDPEPGPEAGPPVEPAAPLPPVEPKTPPEPRVEGRLVSDVQVLLRYDAISSNWQRVPPQGSLLSDELIVALTGFRPKITLGTAVLQAVGGTKIKLLPSGGQKVSGLRIYVGRVLIMPSAEAGTQLRLVVDDHEGVITFADAESVAAIEVSRVCPVGSDPENVAAVLTTRLYAKTGQISWSSGAEGQAVPVAAGASLTIDPAPAEPAVPGDLPGWISLKPLSDPDHRGTSKVEKALVTGGPVSDSPAGLKLTELVNADRPQEEVRRLAARCLGDIDQFKALVDGLNDSTQRLGWLDWPDYYIEYLQQALAQGPKTAATIRQIIERQHPDEAAAMYRMLWGYSAQDLEGGEDAKLVEQLDSRVLAARALAFWNLRKITGYGLSYHPEQPRPVPLQLWRKRLEAGDIRFKSAVQLPKPPKAVEDQPSDPL